MLENFWKSKIKNIEIQNWKLELSDYHVDVEYRHGQLNSAADALTKLKIKKKTTPWILIRATQLFERISVDLKGPLSKSKTSRNGFILTIVDEFSRFV